ncbi:MAG TPA: DegT/DnrJ/EryC1/StrS family aminotransferase [Phycisphaerae bacterium]|nr:DegT/DnrJ/EryC1/StrS family aminotransferase [Phycisphaerae bacterium]
MSEKLAICGGTPALPPGTIKPWPPIEDIDRKMVLASLEGETHTFGPNCKALEEEFAAWNGNKHVLTCNSGTAALHMALVACGCGCGDEVIAPAYTWPSSVTCCIHHNAIPVFVDIDWETMNIDADRIEAAVTPRTKAIMAVHLHGLMADMAKIQAVADRHGLKVIEDCCQSHGATFQGRKSGTFGDCAGFSTNQNKCLCSGEGGFFVTDDPEMFEKGKTLWYFGEHRPPDEGESYHAYGMGWMYRNNDLTAAFARAQLTRLDDYLARQKVNAARLTECLADVPNLILPTTPAGYGHNFYNYTVRFDMEAMGHAGDAKAFRDKLVQALKAEGVDTGIWQGWPVPEMTAFQALDAYGRGCPWSCRDAPPPNYSLEQYPVARRHSDWHTGMTTPLRAPNGPEVAELVAKAFRKVMANRDQVEAIEA